MPARKSKDWIANNSVTSSSADAHKADALSGHQAALAALKADTKALAELSKLATDVAQQESHTIQALEAVTDRLFAESGDTELATEFDRLEAGAARLLVAWRDYVATQVAGQLLGHIEAGHKLKAEPIANELALLSLDYLSVRERFKFPAESWAWTQPLKPLPSQKLDTGLLADPLANSATLAGSLYLPLTMASLSSLSPGIKAKASGL
jgi:hypothetical protein